MKFHNRPDEAEVSGLEASAFGFQMNAKMYDMLISKMYTNKPAAVIRELSANAWDAHVEAGNTDKPFDIQLPSWLDKTFCIRDYGTGIPHDKFEHIYTNVGKSTKEGTDELIGGFGLGSKAPFTMTDTFCVENWYGGVKTTWVCFKSAGVPQVSKVDECPSDEPSGLKVSFTFDTDEVREFTRQITEQLKFFPVKPNVTGGDGPIHFVPLPDGWETKDYFFLDKGSASWRRDCYVVMGNVCYKLPTGQLSSSYSYILEQGITLKVPIGSVDIPPSREHLEMTPRTVKCIHDLLEKVKHDYEKDVTERLQATKSYMEALKVMATVNEYLLTREYKHAMMYHGRNYSSLALRSLYLLDEHTVYAVQNYKGNMRYKQTPIRIQDIVDNKVALLVNDLWSGHKAHIEQEESKLTTAYPGKEIRIVHIDAVPKKDRADTLAKVIREVTEFYGEAPVLLSSIIGHVPVKPKGTQTAKAEANQFYKVGPTVNMSKSIISSSTEVTGDVPSDGYFLELSSHNIIGDPSDNLTGYEIINLLSLGLLDVLDKPVYLVRTKSIPKAPKLIRLNAKVLNALRPTIVPKAEKQCLLRQARANVFIVPPEYAEVLKGTKNKEVKTYVRYAAYIERNTRDSSGNLSTLCSRMYKDWGIPKYTPPTRLHQLSVPYSEVHELLSAVTSTYSAERRNTRLNTLKTLINA
jgi:hypothetical protein